MERQGRVSFFLKYLFSFVCALLISIQQGAVDPAARARTSETTYGTTLGEHRSVEMTDGSRLELNTSSLVSIEMDARSRAMTFHRGEAVLDIAPDSRPFVVHLGEVDFATSQVARAHVRLDSDGAPRLDMLEGEGWVLPAGAPRAPGAGRGATVPATPGTAATAGAIAAAGTATSVTALPPSGRQAFGPIRLTAGNSFSLRYDVRIVEQFDANEMLRNLAWARGQIVLAGDPLREAVAEFNRYNRIQLVIGDESIAALPTGGTFYATEPDTFTRSLSQLFGIHAVRMPLRNTAGAEDIVMLVGAGYSGL